LRDRILAGQFGAGDTLDVYYAAFRIPDLIYNLLILGALSAGFIPVITSLIKDYQCEQKKGSANLEAWQLASNTLNSLVVFIGILSVLGFIFSTDLTRLIAPGFSPAKQDLVSGLTKIMFLSPLFLGASSIIGGILQSFKRFFVYSLSPIFYNLGIIFGAIYLVPLWGIYGLAWGVVIGAFLHLTIQIPAALKLGYRYRLILNFKDHNLRKIGMMMVPRTLSLAVNQINFIVITIIASSLASGSLAVFNLANNLQSFPIGIFGLSFAVAAFPALSIVAFDKQKLVENFSTVFRQILFFVIPATVLLLTLRAQIVRVILGTGEFDWEDTILTINTLGYFSISLFAQACIPLLVRVFYARHNSRTPFYIGLACVIINVFLSLSLNKSLGIAGLALAFSIANILNFILLWFILKMEIGEMDEIRILYSVIKFSLAALACGITVQFAKVIIWPFIDMTRLWGVLTQGFVSGTLGIIAYFIFCYLLRSEELFNFGESIKRRLSWKKVDSIDQGEARGI
ncbi:MAG: murein biosynthesis integral membrane protein MurJ, partial [Candidatus Falkowbacteria bacterium]|nr:murein biosynthesis integral membrane protein MurJ [Candidatus Falkowbacteria bacterium]